MSEQKPWAYGVKAREDPQLSRFLGLATWVSNVLGFLGVVSGIGALITLMLGPGPMGLALVAAIWQALVTVLLFLLGAFVSAAAEVLARCVVGVERPGAPKAEGS